MPLVRICMCILAVIGLTWGADARTEASRLVSEGMAHLEAADAEPVRLVDGAVALAEALDYYQELEDWDKVAEIKAGLFWAKKKMNNDQIDLWLQRQGKEPAQRTEQRAIAVAALEVATKVAEEDVAANQAQEWFDRAEAFARTHGDDPFQVAIRFYEVAERFAGSEVAVKAQRRSLEAQREHMSAINKSNQQQRQSLFTRSLPAGKGAMPVPDRGDQRKAAREIKDLFAECFRERDDAARWKLAVDLLAQAEGTRHDAAMRYTLIMEAIDLATDSGACHLVWDACVMLGQDFEGLEMAEALAEHLGDMRRSDAAQAMQTLLEDPLDAEANLEAGLFFCLDAERWELGLEMLVLSGDEAWRTLAQMEMARPADAYERYEVARAWDALIEDERDERRSLALRRRAWQWYRESLAGLDGIAKTSAEARIAEIEPTIPLLDPDWDDLSATDWERIPGRVIVVQAKKSMDPGFGLPDGQAVRFVPHPTDTWIHNSYSNQTTCTWEGASGYYRSGDNDLVSGELYIQLDGKAFHRAGVIHGPARSIRLGMYTGGYYRSGGDGEIRVKIVPVE